MNRRYHRTKVGSLADNACVVQESADVNVPQLVGTQDGDVIVPTHDWVGYLDPHFCRLKGLMKFHHVEEVPEPAMTAHNGCLPSF